MEEPSLLLVCLAAFIAVFVLLTLLALAMRGLIAVFPEPVEASGAAILAAITAAATAAHPGMKVTKVEEEQ